MIRKEEGFTLVELLITMVVFVLVIAAASTIFSSLLNQFKQQSKIIESNVEGVVGLEIMRVDVQEAGFGIPWFADSNGDGTYDSSDNWTLDVYNEAEGCDNADPTTPCFYNDGSTPSAVPAPAVQRAPRALLATDGNGILGGGGPLLGTGYRSDYLVVKSTSITLGGAAQKWTSITNNGNVNLPAPVMVDENGQPVTQENFEPAEWTIAERAVMGGQQKVLVMAVPPTFSTVFSAVYSPEPDSYETHLIYGVGPEQPRVPFNRADFFVATPATNMPAKCAPNTGILYKAVMNNTVNKSNSGGFQRLPLLDCVADMQVVFITDANADGVPEWNNADFPINVAPANPGGVAQAIREQIKGVVVYILAQEGQRDSNFTFNNFSDCNGDGVADANCILVGPDAALGRAFDLSLIGPDFAHYRWKVYQFAVYPPNLR